MSLSTKRLKAMAMRARDFPTNTCPASRHVHDMALGLLSKDGYPMLADDPKFCAESMLVVVTELWKLRTKTDEARTSSDSTSSPEPVTGNEGGKR